MMYQSVKFAVPVVATKQQSALIEFHFRSIKGVVSAAVTGKDIVVYYRGMVRLSDLQKAYYQAVQMRSKKTSVVSHSWGEEFVEHRRAALISGGGMLVWQLLKLSSPGIFQSLGWLRSLFVLYAARSFIFSGVKSIVKERQPNADTLTSTAVIASILAGKPESSLTLLTLSSCAEMLTTYTAEKARKHISQLLKLDQQFAWKLDDSGHEIKVAVESLRPGDKVSIHLGEKICVDGRVLSGKAAVDQSSITGEYIPAEMEPGSYVYAGTVLQNGYLLVAVEKVGDETAVARIIHMVEEAQARRAPVQNFAERMANLLVPISFIGAGLVYGLTKDWQRVLNMLFIDFSCGLKLSTATAISAAVGRAASSGVLIKGGNYIETLAGIDTVVLDKTGTITVGKPLITSIETAPGVEQEELLLLAASAEYHSAHPLAAAILEEVAQRGWEIPIHSHSDTIIGRGIFATVPDFAGIIGGEVRVGSRRFMQESDVDLSMMPELDNVQNVYNLIYVARNKDLLGLLIISDPIRPTWKKTINQLRRQGVDEVVMITGDTESVARHVSLTLDLDAYHAEVLPEDKANLINKLQHRSQVLMVGDGVNDAPALAFADVGVAMGGKRTDIAVESAAITINSEDPLVLSEAVKLGKRTMKIVHQNFATTIAINSAAMLLGAFGRINPVVSALIHNAATIGVVINSARILLPRRKAW